MSPGSRTIRRDIQAALNHADAGGRDKYLVAFAAIHHFRVAGDELHAGLFGRGAHGFDDATQVVSGQAFFKNERRGQIERARAAHGKIVHGAIDREPADVAAGEEDRRDHEGIGRERKACTVDRDNCLVVEFVENRVLERGKKNLIDQLGGQLAAASMAENDFL